MSDENLHPSEEGNEPTPGEGGGSEDASELGTQGGNEPQSPEDSGDDKDAKIASLEKEVADLRKGMDKAFSQKGQEDKAKANESESTPKEEDSGVPNDLVDDYLDRHPEMEEVRADAEAIAKTTGRSLYNVLRNEPWLKEKANAIAEANKEKTEANRNITKPSANSAPVNPTKDVKNMTNEEFQEHKEKVLQK